MNSAIKGFAKYLIPGGLLTIAAGPLLAAPLPSAIMTDRHTEMLSTYCYECHDGFAQEGGIDLENLSSDMGADIQTAERWQEILNVINAGEMPPKKKKQFTTEEKKGFLDELSNKIVIARKIHGDNGGDITIRRLNRREYVNTIDHLLGIRPNAESLPDDQPGGGFDTAGASLYFSSEQLQQYLALGHRALTAATTLHPAKKASLNRKEAESGTYGRASYQKRLDGFKKEAEKGRAYFAKPNQNPQDFGFKVEREAQRAVDDMDQRWGVAFQEYLLRPETEHGALMLTWRKYGMPLLKTPTILAQKMEPAIIRVRAAALPNVESRYNYLEFFAENKETKVRNLLGWRKVTGTLARPQIIEFPITVPSGELTTYGVSARTHEKKSGSLALYFHLGEIKTPAGVWVDWVELERPTIPAGSTPEAASIFFPKPNQWDELRYAREVINRFAIRAFRTVKPTEDYLDSLVALFQSNRAKGQDTREALLQPLSVILASPTFLYMVESNGTGPLTGPELAVRLSYFLWSAPPDKELMTLAQSGELHQTKELVRQTSRLLSDPRSDRFIEGFSAQWLGMERLGMFQFDTLRYPKYDNAVLQGARDEIYQTLRYALHKKLPLKTLLKSDFIVINDVMADYYGIPNVKGSAFRPVTLPSSSPRGGLLATAAVLSMGADGIRSSPVERGAWVLRHILNEPPPPAPPNVPQIDRLEDHLQPIRLLQRAHQEESQCAQCHQKIDPIGYAMENFDAAGAWRDQEVIRYGRKKFLLEKVAFPIEPSGQLTDGTRFKDFLQLRDVIADRTPKFARGLTESLIAYGLGRPFGFSDYDLAETIHSRAQKGGYSFEKLIHALVQTEAFQSN